MKLNLSKFLVDPEGGNVVEGETICPYMSNYQPVQGALDKEPKLAAFTVLCVGRLCGKVLSCNPDLVKKP